MMLFISLSLIIVLGIFVPFFPAVKSNLIRNGNGRRSLWPSLLSEQHSSRSEDGKQERVEEWMQVLSFPTPKFDFQNPSVRDMLDFDLDDDRVDWLGEDDYEEDALEEEDYMSSHMVGPHSHRFDELFTDRIVNGRRKLFTRPSNYPSPKELIKGDLQYHGTTTLGFKYKDSIILCVDSKASMGNYVGSRTVKKVIPVDKHIVATMAGGAADCAYLIKEVAREKKLFEIDSEASLGVVSVARILSNYLRESRGQELSVGTMVAGWDKYKGAQLYYVDDEGSCVEGDLFCVGSGSMSAYSVLDSIEQLKDVQKEKAIDSALWAVKHATYRDGFSGGYINVIEVNSTGVFHLKRVDCRSLRI